MYRLVTARQMKELDRYAVEELGIPGVKLMENAGRGVVDWLEAELGSLRGKQVAVVCGPGNNGGDGFVACRYLADRGARPVCVLLGSVPGLRGDALVNARRLLDLGARILEVSAADQRLPFLEHSDVIIDAIFGTGLSRPAQGLFADAITAINRAGKYVVSIDVPSGIDAETGEVHEPTVRASLTVTMGLPKYGLVLFPAAACTGKLRVADIGIPAEVLARGGDTFLVDREYVRSVIPCRAKDGHKGTFGTVLLVCGSRGFSGAACLAGRAAVRSGCGLVRLAYPRSISDVVGSQVVEAVKVPLPETRRGTLAAEASSSIVRLAEEVQALAIGPGLTTSAATRDAVLRVLRDVTCPLVIDADAINVLAGQLGILARLKAPAVLTPHPGELGRLTGLEAGRINAQRISLPRKLAKEWNVVLVLKGAPTVTATPDGMVYVNSTGNSGLGTGGTGDVLTGLLAGLLAQGVRPADASVAAAFLHGFAADLAVSELTEYCLDATDLISWLPRAFRAVLARQ